MPPGSITNVGPAVRPFTLSSTVNGVRLGGDFQKIGNRPCSEAIGTPLAHASGEYFKQCAGAALGVAREIMAEVKDAPGQTSRHVAALEKSIAWASPGVGQRYDQFVLNRLTTLGCIHAGISELLDQRPGDATLIGLRASVKDAVGKIAVLGGRGDLPETGTYRADSKTSKRFTDALSDAKGCVIEAMQKAGGSTLLDAIGRAVVAGPLMQSIEARNPELYAKLIQDPTRQLDLMQALSSTWSDKLQANITDLLNSGGYHHVETAISQLLNIPDLVLQPDRRIPAPADKPRPPEAPPGIPQPMLDRAGNGSVFYNHSPNTTNIHMDGFLKELFGQLQEFGGGGFKGGELLEVFNLLNNQFTASRDMLIEHGRLQERVQNQLNINKAQNNELQSAFDTINTLSEKLRQRDRDTALQAFASRGNRRDSDTDSVRNLYDEGSARVRAQDDRAHVTLNQVAVGEQSADAHSEMEPFVSQGGWGPPLKPQSPADFSSPPPAYMKAGDEARIDGLFGVKGGALSIHSSDSGFGPDPLNPEEMGWRDVFDVDNAFARAFGTDRLLADQLQQKARMEGGDVEQPQDARQVSSRIRTVHWVSDQHQRNAGGPAVVGEEKRAEESQIIKVPQPKVRDVAPDVSQRVNNLRSSASVLQPFSLSIPRSRGESGITSDRLSTTSTDRGDSTGRGPTTKEALWKAYALELEGKEATVDSQRYVNVGDAEAVIGSPGTLNGDWSVLVKDFSRFAAESGHPLNVQPPAPKLDTTAPNPDPIPKPQGEQGELLRVFAGLRARALADSPKFGKIGHVAREVKREMAAEKEAASANGHEDNLDDQSEIAFEANRSNGSGPVEPNRVSIEQAMTMLAGPPPVQLHPTNPFRDFINASATVP